MFRDYIDDKINVAISPAMVPLVAAGISVIGQIGSGLLNLWTESKKAKALKKLAEEESKKQRELALAELEKQKMLAEAEKKKAEEVRNTIVIASSILGGSLILMTLLKTLKK